MFPAARHVLPCPRESIPLPPYLELSSKSSSHHPQPNYSSNRRPHSADRQARRSVRNTADAFARRAFFGASLYLLFVLGGHGVAVEHERIPSCEVGQMGVVTVRVLEVEGGGVDAGGDEGAEEGCGQWEGCKAHFPVGLIWLLWLL